MSNKPKPPAAPAQQSLDAAAPTNAQAEAERLAAEKAEAERLAAEKAEAERLAAEKAAQLVDVLMLRRDAIEGTWYPAGAVLHGVPRALVQTLKGDGCVDDDEATVQIALQSGARRLGYVPPAAPEAQADA